MANFLNIDLTGKVVVIDKKYLYPSQHALENRLFRVQSGFGAFPFTTGQTLGGVWLKSKAFRNMGGYTVERLATEEEIKGVRETYSIKKPKVRIGQRKIHFEESTNGKEEKE